MPGITPDTLAPAAARLYEQWAHLEVDGEAEGYPWATLAAALAAPLEPLYALLTAEDLPWGAALDPDALADALEPLEAAGVLPAGFRLAMLAWVGQFAGVLSVAGLDAEGALLRLQTSSGARRGRPATIIAAASEPLTGAKTVRLLERVGSPRHFTVVTRTAETPDVDAVIAAVRAAKPTGHTFEVVVSDEPVIDEGTLTIDTGTATIDTATIDDIT